MIRLRPDLHREPAHLGPRQFPAKFSHLILPRGDGAIGELHRDRFHIKRPRLDEKIIALSPEFHVNRGRANLLMHVESVIRGGLRTTNRKRAEIHRLQKAKVETQAILRFIRAFVG